MQSESRIVVGIFPDITEARRATDDLHSQGISTARLVENELALTFTGTAERSDHGGGIKGFFARLFGLNVHHSEWKLSEDTEAYFRDAYNKKQNLVIIEDCSNVSLCRDIIAARGGISEEQGTHHYQAGASGRVTGDNATDSGLGVDVDRMPFSQSAHPVSGDDRIHNHAGSNADNARISSGRILPPGP